MATLYEDNIRKMLEEKKLLLKRLIESNATQDKIKSIEEEIHALERLYDNYEISMGAFRRTKGARMIH